MVWNCLQALFNELPAGVVISLLLGFHRLRQIAFGLLAPLFSLRLLPGLFRLSAFRFFRLPPRFFLPPLLLDRHVALPLSQSRPHLFTQG